jgi:spore maturation protein CgeB
MSTPYRIVLVHPGSSVSTSDVHNGLIAGLRADGHQVWEYALDGRIESTAQWLTANWRRKKKQGPAPTPAEILKFAGEPLVARALAIMPDVVIVVSAMYLHPDILVLLRRAGIRVAILFTESPYDDERQARLVPWADVCWTNERTSAAAMGIRYLPHAWAPDVHQPACDEDADVPAHDVVFVGTGFQERIDLLSRMTFGALDVGIYGTWNLIGPRSHLRSYLRGGYVSNAKAAALYRRAKIGLNLYRQSMGFGKDAPRITHAESLNPRAYELAATGCFTISDARAEVAEVFGDLVPTFETPDQASELLQQWAHDDRGRAAVAAQLPSAVATATWHTRAQHVIRDLAAVGIVARGSPQQQTVEAVAGG